MTSVLTTPVSTTVAVSVASVQLLAENPFREGVRIVNNSTKRLYLRWGTAPATTDTHESFRLHPGQVYDEPHPVPETPLQGIWFAADGAGSAAITEDVSEEAPGGSLPAIAGITTAPNQGEIRFTVGSQADRGPIVIANADNLFVATNDPTLYLGYNQDANGNVIKAGEPGLSWAIEGDYDDGSGQNKMEAYLQFKKADNSDNLRPLFFQFNRVTEAVTALTLNAPAMSFYDGAAELALWIKNQTTLYAPNASENVLRIKGAASFNSKVTLGAGGVDDIVVFRTASATQGAFDVAGTSVLRFFKAGTGGVLCVGGTQDNNAIIVADNTNVGATYPLFKGRANAAQSADIVKLFASDGTTVYGGFDKSGFFNTRKNAAPADADLAAGQMMLWFDSTNGASKLMVKAKQADGTVKTATVALV